MSLTLGRRHVVAFLALVLVLVALQRWWAWREQGDDVSDGDAAVHAASAEVTRLISVSADDPASTFDKLLDGATSGFRDDLKARAAELRKALAANGVDAKGTVVSAGLARMSSHSASVIIAATGSVSNNATSAPERRDYRVKVDLKKVGDRWLVSGLEFVA